MDTSPKPGVPDAVSTILVDHVSGGVSSIQLQSYDQGRSKWQADTLDWAWLDEEPPEDVYFEVLTRTNTTLGPIMVTMTPLKGMSNVVHRFYFQKPDNTACIMMTIDDVGHYTPEARQQIIASYPEYERDARTKGIPHLGSGRVFPLGDDSLRIPSFPIPSHWPQVCGIDFGWDHPSAGVRCAWARDGDVWYVIAAHRAKQQTPIMFAAAVKYWGEWLPWAWPHDGLQHDKGSGEQLKELYAREGLKMLPQRAQFENESFGVEAGIADMLDRMQTGRFKVFTHLSEWFEEFNMYHRVDGKIVKERDDLLSATRYALMMKRFAVLEKKPVKLRYIPHHTPQGWMT